VKLKHSRCSGPIRRLSLLTLALMVLVVLVVGVQVSAAPIVLKFAHNQRDGHPYDVGARKFAELVELKTNGRVKVQVFPNSVLGGGQQAVDGVRMGTIDFTAEHTSLLEGYIREMGVFGMVHFFEDWDHFWAVVDGDIGREFESKLEKHGFKVLGWFRNGLYHCCTRQKVMTPSDLKGLKFRSKPGSTQAIMQDKAFGTVSTSVDYSELYSGFQLGVVDGMFQNPTNLRATTLYEVTPYIALTASTYATNPLTMSLKKFNSLPKDIQNAIMEAGREASAYERAFSEKTELEDVEFLKQQPKVVFSYPNKGVWNATWSNVESWAKSTYGKDLIERMNALKQR